LRSHAHRRHRLPLRRHWINLPAQRYSMQQSREAVIRAGEAHCQRFNDPEVCHEKK
jgi:hypothetical protein